MPPPAPTSLLEQPQFLRVWFVGALASTIRWLELLAVGVYVFDATGSPFQVALFTMLRMLPLGLFGAFGGVLGERFNRSHVLMAGLAGMCLISLALGTLVVTGRIELWHIALGTFLNGIFWVTDFSVRRPMLAEIAGIARMGRALALDTLTANGSRMLGPLLGGALLELVGLGGAYFLGAALYVLGVIAISTHELADVPAERIHEGIWRSVFEGLRSLREQRLTASVLLVTIVFNLWGFPFLSMVPVIGKESLGLSAFPVGLLTSAEGAGALLGASAVALFIRARFYRLVYLAGVVLCMLAALGFAHSPWATAAGLSLFVAGFGIAGFASMQSTLVLVHTPPANRGRMMGVLAMCIGTAPLGLLHLGWLAGWLGPHSAITVIAIEGLVALALVCRFFPEILWWKELEA